MHVEVIPREPTPPPPFTAARSGTASQVRTGYRCGPLPRPPAYWAGDPSHLHDAALAVLRITFGLMVFFFHGLPNVTEVATYLGTGVTSNYLDAVAQMDMPAPALAAGLAAAALLLGGLLLAVGLLTRPVATVLTGVLCGALAQNLMSGRDPQLAVLYALVAVTFALAGGGRYSLDTVLSGRPIFD